MPIGSYDGDNVRINPQWAVDCLWKKVDFLNGSSRLMNVNGSVTPVNFTFAPSAGEIWYVKRVSIFVNDNGSNVPGNFGALSALTNGLQLQIQSKGIAQDIANARDNIDLNMIFSYDKFTSGTTGLFESSDVFSGCLEFDPTMVLVGDNSDYIRFRVRDNLTGADFIRAAVSLWKANP